MNAPKGTSPGLKVQIDNVDEVAADTIFVTADIGYWGRVIATGKNEHGQITYVHYVLLDQDDGLIPRGGMEIGPDRLKRAINALLRGEQVGSHLHEQILKDTFEWQEDPDYGPGYDSEVCDYIIQIALFGEVVYG